TTASTSTSRPGVAAWSTSSSWSRCSSCAMGIASRGCANEARVRRSRRWRRPASCPSRTPAACARATTSCARSRAACESSATSRRKHSTPIPRRSSGWRAAWATPVRTRRPWRHCVPITSDPVRRSARPTIGHLRPPRRDLAMPATFGLPLRRTMQKTERIWLDGELVPWDTAQVHVTTHTLHYGLGVFEGIRCYAGDDGGSAIFRLREHLDRLFGSAHVLELAMPYSREQLVDACRETVRANRLRECYLRPIAFLGDGDMGLSARPATRVAIIVWPWGAYLGEDGIRNGVRLKTSSFQRFHPNTMLTKAKAVGHYVNSILAAQEARGGGYDEALLLDVDGYVSEASGENIFIVQQGVVKTTPLPTVLGGITR